MAKINMSQNDGKALPFRSRIKDARVELPRPSRTQLLFEFDMQRDVLSREQDTLDYFLPVPYPPSELSLSDLQAIAILDLRYEKRYSGGVVYAKTIESAVRAAAIQTIIEDEEGQAERLAVYNVDLKVDAEEFLPEDVVIALKEPTLTSAASGGYTIRIDHPSDLMVLDPSDSKIPTNLLGNFPKSTETALQWKQKGNEAYSARKYITAISAYSRGLKTCGDNDTDLKYDLLRNRAVANIFLGRYKQGLVDAESAVIPPLENADEKVSALNTKAYERAGHAAYALGDYERACQLYEQALKLSPDQKESLNALKKVKERQEEQKRGSYDFETMSKSCNKKRNRLDHADFLSNAEIRDAGKHGRGLFTTKNIEAGDLVICEKAFCVWFDSEPISRPCSILNSRTKSRAIGTKPPLLFSVCSKLSSDINAAKEYFKLYDGQTKDTVPKEVDGNVAVDCFRVLSILDHNSIGCPTVRSSSKESQKQLTGDGYPSTGIWSRISYINHACNGNAMRSFIGDMMIIRATRTITKGEEIFMPYLLPNVDNTISQSQLQSIWGFKCDCELCIAEASTTTNQRKQRVHFNDKLKDLSSKQPGKVKASTIDDLYLKAKRTYNEQRFEHRPRVALIGIGWLSCKIHYQDKSWDKLSRAAINLLEDLAYGIEIQGQILKVDRQHCLTHPIGIDAALYAAQGHKKQGHGKVGSQFDAFAKSLWVVMYGAERGFEDKVKDLFEQ